MRLCPISWLWAEYEACAFHLQLLKYWETDLESKCGALYPSPPPYLLRVPFLQGGISTWETERRRHTRLWSHSLQGSASPWGLFSPIPAATTTLALGSLTLHLQGSRSRVPTQHSLVQQYRGHQAAVFRSGFRKGFWGTSQNMAWTWITGIAKKVILSSSLHSSQWNPPESRVHFNSGHLDSLKSRTAGVRSGKFPPLSFQFGRTSTSLSDWNWNGH